MPQSTESQAPIVPIIGGGPAGMSCALWLHNYGLKPVIIEQADALGGMARLSPYPNAWLLGERGKTVRENAAEFAAHIRELAVETWLGARPQRLRREHDERFRLDVACTPAARSLSGPAIDDSDPLDEELRKDGIEMIAPHRSNRSKPPTQDRRRLSRYMRRWLVERFFAWIQWQRRILVRWEYYAQNFLGFVQLACLVVLFRRF